MLPTSVWSHSQRPCLYVCTWRHLHGSVMRFGVCVCVCVCVCMCVCSSTVRLHRLASGLWSHTPGRNERRHRGRLWSRAKEMQQPSSPKSYYFSNFWCQDREVKGDTALELSWNGTFTLIWRSNPVQLIGRGLIAFLRLTHPLNKVPWVTRSQSAFLSNLVMRTS